MIKLKYSFLVLFIAFDLLILPMMSIGPIPFKISFLILIITYFNYNKSEKISDVIYFKNNILILLFLGVVGEIFFGLCGKSKIECTLCQQRIMFLVQDANLDRRSRNHIQTISQVNLESAPKAHWITFSSGSLQEQ